MRQAGKETGGFVVVLDLSWNASSFQRVRAHLQVRRIHRETSQPIPLTLPEDSFRAHNCEKPGLEVQLTKHELLTMYREMQIIRRMEMEAEELYKAELVRGYCHLAIGQVSFISDSCTKYTCIPLTGSRLDRS